MPQDGRRNHRRSHSGRQHPDLLSMGQHARGFVSAAFIGAARHVSGQSSGNVIPGTPVIPGGRADSRQSTRDPRGRDVRGRGPRSRQDRRSQQSRRPWTIPQNRRPQLIVGKGDISQVFSCLTQLWTDCPGAAVAVCRYITMHQRTSDANVSYALDRARNTFTRMARKATPNATSLASAQEGLVEAQSSPDRKGQLTAATTYLEEQYLRFVHGLHTELGLRQLADQLVANADQLAHADSEGRQAHPRIMAADCFLQLGDIHAADEQFARGCYLIGKAYPNQELLRLGEAMQAATSTSSQAAPIAAGARTG